MKLKVKMISMLLFYLLNFSCFGKNNKEIIIFNKLIGVWNPIDMRYGTIVKEFEWGLSKFTTHVSVTFEKGKNGNLLISTPGNILEILSIKMINNNKIELNYFVDNNEHKLFIKIINNNKINIINGMLYFDEEEYKKIGGPDLKDNFYHTPTVKKLSLRNGASLDYKRIRILEIGEKIMVLEYGKREKIDNIDGNWVKVKTEQGEIGWCFDAYLEEVK